MIESDLCIVQCNKYIDCPEAELVHISNSFLFIELSIEQHIEICFAFLVELHRKSGIVNGAKSIRFETL